MMASMSTRAAVRLAWVVFGVVALSMACGLVLSALSAAGQDAVSWTTLVSGLLLWFAMFTFPVAGVLVATRQPRNPIAWILLAVGLVWELAGAFAESYVYYALVTAPGALPRPDLVAVLTSSSWVPGIGLIGTFLLLLFPDGRLASPRWRPFAWFTGIVLAGLTIVMPLLPAPLRDVAADGNVAMHLPDVANPLGLDALHPVQQVIFPLVFVVPLCIAGSALSLVGRFRRSSGQERLQLKWLAAAAAISAMIYGVTMVLSLLFGGELWNNAVSPGWLTALQNLAVFVFLLIPVAVGIAILRYRLYDIDVIIRRTLVYGVLTAALALAYVAGVVTVSAITGAVTGQANNNVAVAASTLAVAGLFSPLRRRVQSFIDRRFYRRHYDSQQTVAAFSARLRDRLDPAAVGIELVAQVTTTVHPSGVSLWLRPPPMADRSERRS